MSPAATFEWPVRVYYEDTDTAGVVYYANYLRFCERARTEWLRAVGVQQQKLLDEGTFGFVVTAVEARYRRPARLDDELRVVSFISAARRASLTFCQNIYRADELLFEAQISVACIHPPTQRPIALPDSLRASLQISS
jgi:acyl-CoA thioester hydrolase